MADGMIVPPMATRSGAGKGLLFPVTPQPDETLLGYIVRCLEENHLGKPGAFLSQIDVNMGIKGDYLSRLSENLDKVASLFGVEREVLARLWGSEPLTESGKRRLGGVHLRPYLVYQARRRFLPSLPLDRSDRSTWMVRHLNFCPDSWELLVDRCPLKECSRPLTWPGAKSLHHCAYCGWPLSGWRTRKVARSDRPSLTWVLQLFSEDEKVRERALSEIPTFFEINSATDAYEMALVFGHACQLERSGGNFNPDWQASDLAAGVRMLLEYPRSIWDLYRGMERRVQPALLGDLMRIGRDHGEPIVNVNIRRLITHHRTTAQLGRGSFVCKGDQMNAAGVGRVTGLSLERVRKLAEAGLLQPVQPTTCQTKEMYHRDRVGALRASLRASMPWERFVAATRLPAIAIEQLLALGWLSLDSDPVVRLAYGPRSLRRDGAEAFVKALETLPVNELAGYAPLSAIFRGVGGRDKPWAPVLTLGLKGSLPGGLRWIAAGNRSQLAMDERVARALIMGGPESRSPYRFERRQYGDQGRDWFEPHEVETYLNCTAQDVSWLRQRDYLKPEPRTERTRYLRDAVEALGRRFMSSREAAARLGALPKDLWLLLEAYGDVPSIGQGFHDRASLERLLRLEALNPTWWS